MRKPTEGKTFAEVFSEIRYKIKPKDNGAVKRLLSEKALVSSLEPTCSSEIRDLGCLTEKNEAEEAIKRECPEVTNARIGITSANSQGQKIAVVEIAEQ